MKKFYPICTCHKERTPRREIPRKESRKLTGPRRSATNEHISTPVRDPPTMPISPKLYRSHSLPVINHEVIQRRDSDEMSIYTEFKGDSPKHKHPSIKIKKELISTNNSKLGRFRYGHQLYVAISNFRVFKHSATPMHRQESPSHYLSSYPYPIITDSYVHGIEKFPFSKAGIHIGSFAQFDFNLTSRILKINEEEEILNKDGSLDNCRLVNEIPNEMDTSKSPMIIRHSGSLFRRRSQSVNGRNGFSWFCQRHDAFPLRIGPNYKYNRQKAPSPTPLMLPIGVDVYWVNKAKSKFASDFNLEYPDISKWVAKQIADLQEDIRLSAPAKSPNVFQKINYSVDILPILSEAPLILCVSSILPRKKEVKIEGDKVTLNATISCWFILNLSGLRELCLEELNVNTHNKHFRHYSTNLPFSQYSSSLLHPGHFDSAPNIQNTSPQCPYLDTGDTPRKWLRDLEILTQFLKKPKVDKPPNFPFKAIGAIDNIEQIGLSSSVVNLVTKYGKKPILITDSAGVSFKGRTSEKCLLTSWVDRYHSSVMSNGKGNSNIVERKVKNQNINEIERQTRRFCHKGITIDAFEFESPSDFYHRSRSDSLDKNIDLLPESKVPEKCKLQVSEKCKLQVSEKCKLQVSEKSKIQDKSDVSKILDKSDNSHKSHIPYTIGEISFDTNKWGILARTTFSSVSEKMTRCILRVGYLVEFEKDDHLPERLLGCLGLKHVRFEGAPELI